MTQTTIKQVRKGGFFRLVNNECAPLWVRGYYYAPDKVYECYMYDDVNHEHFWKGTKKVWAEEDDIK